MPKLFQDDDTLHDVDIKRNRQAETAFNDRHRHNERVRLERKLGRAIDTAQMDEDSSDSSVDDEFSAAHIAKLIKCIREGDKSQLNQLARPLSGSQKEPQRTSQRKATTAAPAPAPITVTSAVKSQVDAEDSDSDSSIEANMSAHRTKPADGRELALLEGFKDAAAALGTEDVDGYGVLHARSSATAAQHGYDGSSTTSEPCEEETGELASLLHSAVPNGSDFLASFVGGKGWAPKLPGYDDESDGKESATTREKKKRKRATASDSGSDGPDGEEEDETPEPPHYMHQLLAGEAPTLTHPRRFEDGLRKSKTKRAEAKARRKESKRHELTSVREEAHRLRALRKAELESRITEIDAALGLSDPKKKAKAGLSSDAMAALLEGDDWDPDAYDAFMEKQFGAQFDELSDSSMDDAFAELEGLEQRDDEPTVPLPTGETKATKSRVAADSRTTRAERLRRRDALTKELSLLQGGHDVDAVIHGATPSEPVLKTRFRYIDTQPASFGLTDLDVLNLPDRVLNQIVPVTAYAPHHTSAHVRAATKRASKLITMFKNDPEKFDTAIGAASKASRKYRDPGVVALAEPPQVVTAADIEEEADAPSPRRQHREHAQFADDIGAGTTRKKTRRSHKACKKAVRQGDS